MTAKDMHARAIEYTSQWLPELTGCVSTLDEHAPVPGLVSKASMPQALTLITLYGLLSLQQEEHRRLLRILQLTIAGRRGALGLAALAMCHYQSDMTAQEGTVTWRLRLDGDGFARITSAEYGGYTAQWEYELHSDWKLNGTSATDEQLAALDKKISRLSWNNS